MTQMSLPLIQREVSGSLIEQRSRDGYINATQLCNVAGKRWHNYIATESNGHFIRALCENLSQKQDELIQEIHEKGVSSVWVHPHIAVHLAQWLSAKFAVQVSKWVTDWASDVSSPFGKPKTKLPYHVERYMLNANSVPAGYFSILQEMTFLLIAPLEHQGYELPERMVPDISMGRFLCKRLRDALGVDTDSLPVYIHTYPDGRKVEAKIYPEAYLGEFRRMIREDWLPAHAAKYFSERDSSALPYLNKVVMLPSAKPLLPSKFPKRKAA